MYSENDLQSAVAAGVLTREAAEALRNHVAGTSNVPHGDEEQFRLITGFNDIFVGIAAIILLVAMGGIGQYIHDVLAGVLVAGASWGLAEFFTRKRRMALPSIILLISFIGGLVAAQVALVDQLFHIENDERAIAFAASGVALVTAFGAWLHWRRFMVPITVAAGAAALAATAIALIIALVTPARENAESLIMTLVLIAGLSIFTWAMRWDMSDRTRDTRRSDVAFWLHLAAAPMIAHPIFWLMGVTHGDGGSAGSALLVLATYIAMGLVAIIIDRRALLVSALAYVLFALTLLFREFGVIELNVAITALVIGSGLLSLSAFWTPIRRAVVDRLPQTLRDQLPITHLATV